MAHTCLVVHREIYTDLRELFKWNIALTKSTYYYTEIDSAIINNVPHHKWIDVPRVHRWQQPTRNVSIGAWFCWWNLCRWALVWLPVADGPEFCGATHYWDPHKRSHTIIVLFSLLWLAVHQWVEFKILPIMYLAVHHLRPEYLASLVAPYSPTCPLRTAGQRQLTIPWYMYHLEWYGYRFFSVAGPTLWNNLLSAVRYADSVEHLRHC